MGAMPFRMDDGKGIAPKGRSYGIESRACRRLPATDIPPMTRHRSARVVALASPLRYGAG